VLEPRSCGMGKISAYDVRTLSFISLLQEVMSIEIHGGYNFFISLYRFPIQTLSYHIHVFYSHQSFSAV